MPVRKPTSRRIEMERSRLKSMWDGVHGTIRTICFGGAFFLGGMLFQLHPYDSRPVEASSERLYQLMVYHALPDKAPALASIFRDVSKLQSKHGLETVGYWVPESDDPAWKNTFV